MRHLIICREYPPAPGGGIGTYAENLSRLLAANGETVHVIGQLSGKAQNSIDEQCGGRLIIHRVPFWEPLAYSRPGVRSARQSKVARALFASDFPPLGFSWLAGALAERLVETEGIDVIEAQDYEAPLYYFQLRRALGLGPKHRPPCLIHLHSPTEFIARYNDWEATRPSLRIAQRVENYSISAADRLLCPSRFLARQATAHYGLPADAVEVIPYPLGTVAKVARQQAAWSEGSICYVGRLEKRKGVLEWIEAAVGVAQRHDKPLFEFVGANILAANPILSEAVLDGLIPRGLQRRFIFHGKVDRGLIPGILQRSRIAVVPSRWENFPNACIESMASGLPVIASPEGGMAEMIADGHTGWLAEGANSAALQRALERALATPPRQIAAMGEAAADSIRQLCDNEAFAERHMSLRRRLLTQGVRSSLSQPFAGEAASQLNRRAALEAADVLVDFPANGSAHGREGCSEEPQSRGRLEQFRSLVAADAESKTPFFPWITAGSGWNGRGYDPLKTIRCLVGNPKIGLRVFHQLAAELAGR